MFIHTTRQLANIFAHYTTLYHTTVLHCALCHFTRPGQWAEQSSPLPTIQFESISTGVLEKVIQYWYYKKRYDGTAGPVPKFQFDQETIVKVLLAANFLDT